jgi:hypothetical protein
MMVKNIMNIYFQLWKIQLYKYRINPIVNLLKYKKQLILQGPPGTGKQESKTDCAKYLRVR